jgi:hypothetical protein
VERRRDYARVLAYPDSAIKVECRLAALLERSDGSTALTPPRLVSAGASAARALIERLLAIEGSKPVVRFHCTNPLR